MRLRRRRSEAEEIVRLRQAEPFVQSMADPPEWLRCPVCRHVVPDHVEHCFMRPGALTAPRGGIAYERQKPSPLPGARWDAHGGTTPLYDELAAERRLDPCREAMVRRNERTFRELSERFARSAAVPGPMILPGDAVAVEVTPPDPFVAHAEELYRLGHFGTVGSYPARRALAEAICPGITRPRVRTGGWGSPIERTDP